MPRRGRDRRASPRVERRPGRRARGVRRHRRDPQGPAQQVRGRPRDRPDPARPHALHLDAATRPTTASSRTPSARTATRSTRSCLLDEPTFPGCLILCRAIGMFRMTDEAGGDDKLLCVPGQRPAPGAPARHRPRPRVRPAGDPALLRGLQGPRARQVGRGRPLGRPRGRRAVRRRGLRPGPRGRASPPTAGPVRRRATDASLPAPGSTATAGETTPYGVAARRYRLAMTVHHLSRPARPAALRAALALALAAGLAACGAPATSPRPPRAGPRRAPPARPPAPRRR